jgi:hypothetical protein
MFSLTIPVSTLLLAIVGHGSCSREVYIHESVYDMDDGVGVGDFLDPDGRVCGYAVFLLSAAGQ